MVVIELGGEAPQAVQRATVVVLGPCGAQLMLDLRPVAVGQVIEHIALLMAYATMDGHRAEHVVDLRSERLAAIEDDEHALLDSRPLSTRSASSATVIVLFSVEPSHKPSGTFTPSVVTPSATTQQRPFRSIP
jgi:hypothetical protein